MRKTLLYFLFIFFLIPFLAKGQNQNILIHGIVIDSSSGLPLQRVSIFQNASGIGTLTDQDGYYSITLNRNGNLRFSYLGYKELVVPIKMLSGDKNINISLSIFPFFTPELNITARKMYKLDSLNFRKENKDIFSAKRIQATNYAQANTRTSNYSPSVLISPSSIFNNYLSSRERHLRAYRKTLERAEKITYIEKRFNASTVNHITGLSGSDLGSFIEKNKPDYQWLVSASDYDLYLFIQERFKLSNSIKFAEKK